MSSPDLKAHCLDCRHLWLPKGDVPTSCPRCGGDQVIARGVPWCWMQPRALLYIQHRLARFTDRQIAERYAVQPSAVRKTLSLAMRVIRHRSRLRCHEVADLLLIAQADGLEALVVTPVTQPCADTPVS